VPAGAPREFAICAAVVVALPYRLDESGLAAVWAVAAVPPLEAHVALEPVPPPVVHDVGLLPFAVALVGFAPASAPAFWSALPPPEACVETEA
jgi:hypothetical protein